MVCPKAFKKKNKAEKSNPQYNVVFKFNSNYKYDMSTTAKYPKWNSSRLQGAHNIKLLLGKNQSMAIKHTYVKQAIIDIMRICFCGAYQFILIVTKLLLVCLSV